MQPRFKYGSVSNSSPFLFEFPVPGGTCARRLPPRRRSIARTSGSRGTRCWRPEGWWSVTAWRSKPTSKRSSRSQCRSP